MLYPTMLLTPYGIWVWLPLTVIAAALACLCAWLEVWWAFAIVIALWLALMSFFRDPIRRIRTDLPPEQMLSPADGTVTAVFDVESHEAIFGNGPARVVRIFLSVLNVHINRSPCDAEVVSCRHFPGKFLNAQTEESARVNEANLITLRIASGETIGLRQVAGMIARAIVCPLRPGDKLKRGQKFGMIKFGSTTELILPRPQDAEVHVKTGDKVRGGLTVVATLRERVEATSGN